MEKKLTWLYSLLGIVFLFTTISVLNEIITLNIEDITARPIYQKALAGENIAWHTSEQSLRYSAYFVKGLMVGARLYLLLGFIYIFKVFKAFKENSYFSEDVSVNFKKAGKVFIHYCILIFSLEIVYLFITLDSAPALDLLRRNHIDFIALIGISFSILSHIFKEGKLLKEENDLTV